MVVLCAQGEPEGRAGAAVGQSTFWAAVRYSLICLKKIVAVSRSFV